MMAAWRCTLWQARFNTHTRRCTCKQSKRSHAHTHASSQPECASTHSRFLPHHTHTHTRAADGTGCSQGLARDVVCSSTLKTLRHIGVEALTGHGPCAPLSFDSMSISLSMAGVQQFCARARPLILQNLPINSHSRRRRHDQSCTVVYKMLIIMNVQKLGLANRGGVI